MIIFIFLITLPLQALNLNSHISRTLPEEVSVHKIFKTKGIDIKGSTCDEVASVYKLCHSLSYQDLITALDITTDSLESYERKLRTPSKLSLKEELLATIVQFQKKHIIEYVKELKNQLTFTQRCHLALQKMWLSFTSWFRHFYTKEYTSLIEQCAKKFEWYTTFEREYLLNEYETALLFFTQQEKVYSPECLKFWHNDSDKIKILLYLHELNPKITVQAEVIEDAATVVGSTMIETVENAAADAVQDAEQSVEQEVDSVMDSSEGMSEQETEQATEEAAGADASESGGQEEQPDEESAEVDAQASDVEENLGDPESFTKETEEDSQTIESAQEEATNVLESPESEEGEIAELDLEESEEGYAQTEGNSESTQEGDEDKEELTEEDFNALKEKLKNDPDSLTDDELKTLWEHGDELPEDLQDDLNEAVKTKGYNEMKAEKETVKPKAGKERWQELRAHRTEENKKLLSTLKDKNASFGKRSVAFLKLTYNTIMAPVHAATDVLDAFVTSKIYRALNPKFIERINNNPLRRAILRLPPSQQGLAGMFLQMEVMSASSLVGYWDQQKEAEKYAAAVKRQQDWIKKNTTFTNLVTVQQQKLLQKANVTYLKTTGAIQVLYNDAYTLQAFEQLWIQQYVYASLPQSSYVNTTYIQETQNLENNTTTQGNALQDDIQFSLSSMVTPETIRSGILQPTAPGAWHNVLKEGNWEFLPQFNAFYQLGLVSLAGLSTEQQAQAVLLNTIFREFIPAQQPQYRFSVNITLYAYEFPFFIGFLFNKGRWISGVPDKYNQVRFAGLYGSADKKIYFVCEESQESSSQALKNGAPSTQSPFYRILTNPSRYTKHPVEINKTPAQHTITVTYYDMVETDLSRTIMASLTPTQTTPTAKPIVIRKDNFSLNNGLQHNIGFVSAGCIGAFSLTEPTALTYSQTELDFMTKFITTTTQEKL